MACQWKRSSPMGPAEQLEGGSLPSSVSSLWILFRAMLSKKISGQHHCIYERSNLNCAVALPADCYVKDRKQCADLFILLC